MGADIGDYRIFGFTDRMAAGLSVTHEPATPYFFIHEYKKFRAPEADPLGQLLATMPVSQTLNNDGKQIYGCYVVANIWYFVLLNGKSYEVSQGYDASGREEIRKVWSILEETKIRIQARIEQRMR